MKRFANILLYSVLFAGATMGLRKLFWNEFNIEIVIQAMLSGILTAIMFEFFFFKFLKKTGNKLLQTIPDAELNIDEKLVLNSCTMNPAP